MHDTLSSLVERALTGTIRPLEFYLREHSRLPGPRANLELASDVSYALAAATPKSPDRVYALINHFANGDHQMVASNTPDEFVMMCGIIAFGACAASYPAWRKDTFALLNHYAASSNWRIREGVVIAYQRLLTAIPRETIEQLNEMANTRNYLLQRAAIAALAEPDLLYTPEIMTAALHVQRPVLEHIRATVSSERKTEDFKVLRRTLGYTLSVVTAASPEAGFALMRECAGWKDADVNWILRENLKKKRLAKFSDELQALTLLLS